MVSTIPWSSGRQLMRDNYEAGPFPMLLSREVDSLVAESISLKLSSHLFEYVLHTCLVKKSFTILCNFMDIFSWLVKSTGFL